MNSEEPRVSRAETARQTLSFLKRRFQEAGIRPHTKRGQNFLIDLNLLDVLVEAAQLTPDDVVLEIGTGTGSLTALMAPRVAAVVTVEIDPRMFQLAGEELHTLENVTMLRTDALKNKNHFNPEVLDAVNSRLGPKGTVPIFVSTKMGLSPSDQQYKLVANLPYQVATPIISNLLAEQNPPQTMTVTIQKELAQRITARPGSKDYSALSIWIQSQARAQILRELAPTVFWPRPKVASVFLRIVFDPGLRSRLGDLGFFHDFVRAIFFHRRKFLRTQLGTAVKGRLDKARLDAILQRFNLAPSLRAEQLDVDTIISLSKAVHEELSI